MPNTLYWGVKIKDESGIGTYRIHRGDNTFTQLWYAKMKSKNHMEVRGVGDRVLPN